MKICFLDNSNISYTSEDIYSNKLRGGENTLINLSNEFSKLDHEVTIYNNSQKNCKIKNISWINLNQINDNPHYDLAISNNDIRLFDKISSTKKIAISYSIQSIEKFIRKGQFISYLKHKPKIALLGKYHQFNRNILLRIFGSFQISLAVDDIFLNSEIKKNVLNDQAIFTSYSDRNLDLLVNIWKNKIYPINKKRKLLITPIKENYHNYNIFNRIFGDKKILLNDILNSRICLIPGHKAELFCIAAEEARELCVPIITLGIGSLSERVLHNKTGFVAKNPNEFADYTTLLFNDDKLWFDIRKNLFNLRGSKIWKNIAIEFLKRSNE
tara:strand:- start:972 stop:1952 length:981 start_codon:yes stop_codon:yes gene_type:complete